MWKGILFWVLIIWYGLVKAETIKVGYHESAPYVYSRGGVLEGIHVSLWEEVAKENHLDFEYVSFDSFAQLEQSLEQNAVQVGISPFSYDPVRMKKIDLSAPTYISEIGVIAQKNFKHTSWFKAILEIISLDYFIMLMIVGAIIFLFGFLMWMMERTKNTAHFDKSHKGLLDSFWWSAVTMTTVGYGDKYPITFGGRVVALVWMFTAMVIIATITAGISSLLTVSNLSSGISSVEDLSDLHVATISKSTSEDYLKIHLSPVPYSAIDSAVADLKAEKIDALVYEKPFMRHYINLNLLQKEIEILPFTLTNEIKAFAYAPGFKQRKVIDGAIASIWSSPDYHWILSKEGLDKN